MKIINNKGQLIPEYILLITIILMIFFLTVNTITTQTQKNTILTSAQIGAQIGIDKNGYAMYYNDTFNNYQENYPKLLNPAEIKIISINMTEINETIELQPILHSNTYLTYNEQYIVGSRVNYYIRKTIMETFQKQSNDIYYEDIQINNNKIKTKTVKWV